MTSLEIIEEMKRRPLTKKELSSMLGFSERATRGWVQRLKKYHPVISSSKHAGYMIATTPDQVALVTEAIKDNHLKAISILSGNKQLKVFAKHYNAELPTLPLFTEE